MRQLRSLYPAQSGPANSGYPYGSFRNRMFVGDPQGTPVEARWANDIQGFMAALMNKAGFTPNNLPEMATISQCADAVEAIAQQQTYKGSFSWPNTSNAIITSGNDLYSLTPLWGSGSGTNFLPSLDNLYQTRRSDPSNWAASLTQPPGRWQIMSMRARVIQHDNTPSVSPFTITLRRHPKDVLTTATDIAQLQWGNGGSGSELSSVSISSIGTYYMAGNMEYSYTVHVNGEEDSVEQTIANLPKIIDFAVLLKFAPF